MGKVTVKQIHALHALSRRIFATKLNALHLTLLNKHFGTDYTNFGQIPREVASSWISKLQELQNGPERWGGEII